MEGFHYQEPATGFVRRASFRNQGCRINPGEQPAIEGGSILSKKAHMLLELIRSISISDQPGSVQCAGWGAALCAQAAQLR